MRYLQLSDFQQHLGTVFSGRLADGEVPFQLVEAAPLRNHPVPHAYRQPFSLMFRNEAAILLPQQSYLLSHSEMGEQAIFLVPVGRDATGFLYQAVFN